MAVTGNVSAGNVSGTTGAFTTVTGAGSGLTSLNASNLASGTVPSARLSGTYTITVSGAATTAGTVTTAAQPNITSVGTLTSLGVTGNVSTGNVSGTLGAFTTVTGAGSGLTSLNGTNIASGTVAAARIASLDAAKITTGTFADARIPNLNASKITAGTLAVLRGGTGVTTSTGSGNNVLSTSPVLTTPSLGTPSAGTLTSCTGLPIVAGTTGTLSVARGGTGVTTSTGSGAVVLGTSPTFTTQITVPAIVKSGTNGVGNIGASGSTFNTIFAKATSAQYADLAEMYEADQPIDPGVVVCFGGAKEVTICETDACRRVAGVVSTNPSYLMNSAQPGEHVVAVALTGRVPVRVSGPVRKGDMMVAAGNGRARADADPKMGAVIGKALEDFDGQEGVIEVVVGRM